MTFSAAQNGAQLLDRIVVLIINPAILLIFSVGFLVFIWGLMQFMRHVEEGSAHKEGVQHMIWGIIGMFIMIAVSGIISLIDDTFGLNIRGQTFDVTQSSVSAPSNPFPTGQHLNGF